MKKLINNFNKTIIYKKYKNILKTKDINFENMLLKIFNLNKSLMITCKQNKKSHGHTYLFFNRTGKFGSKPINIDTCPDKAAGILNNICKNKQIDFIVIKSKKHLDDFRKLVERTSFLKNKK